MSSSLWLDEFMEREMGGWTSRRRRRGHADTLPEHSAHLLCISVPIQTFNMLKWHLHLSLKVAASCGGEISEKCARGLVFCFCIRQMDSVLSPAASDGEKEMKCRDCSPTYFLLAKLFSVGS